MATFSRIGTAFSLAWRWLHKLGYHLNEALAEPQRLDADLFTGRLEESVFQPQATRRGRLER